MNRHSPIDITGLVLAGGEGRRMGGLDKGLQSFAGRPMVATVIERLAPQVDALLVNANRNADQYARLGHAVIADRQTGHAGPLAGLQAGLAACTTRALLTVPCDSPGLPADLTARLATALVRDDADIAVAVTEGRDQPVFALVNVRVREHLDAFLAAGGRKIDAWYATLSVTRVDFDDQRDAFANINTPAELAALEVRLGDGNRLRSNDVLARAPARQRLSEFIAGITPDYRPDALPVDDARRIAAGFVRPVSEQQTVSILDALGRVLAEPIRSPIDVPAHDNSAMDGYAVRGSDLGDEPVELTRIGEAFAGRPFAGRVDPGQCVRVMTGAVMPDGADTVVVQEVCSERTTAEGQTRVRIGRRPATGENVRYAGEDLACGRIVLDRGHRLRPADLGLVASLGIGTVQVWRKPRVAFFSTGDELASIGQPLGPGQVYDSNRYTLHGMLARLGVESIDLGVVRDDPAELRSALERAASQADAIITSGGVSVGEADFIRGLMNELGEVAFWTIAMRPGRPMAFGRIGEAAFFGLPGNPVAVMVTFYQFVMPALRCIAGSPADGGLVTLSVPTREALRKRPGRTEYQRGVISRDPDGQQRVSLTGQQGSGVLRSMSEANCLIVLEHERGDIAAGDPVTVQVFEGLT
jgi:molybdopterin molybdotransferase